MEYAIVKWNGTKWVVMQEYADFDDANVVFLNGEFFSDLVDIYGIKHLDSEAIVIDGGFWVAPDGTIWGCYVPNVLKGFTTFEDAQKFVLDNGLVTL